MAEFAEVMRQARRLCRAQRGCGRSCPLWEGGKAWYCRIDTVRDSNVEKAEKIVMKWAAAHPEELDTKPQEVDK